MSNLSYNVLEKNIKIEDCFFDDFDIFLIKINGDTYSNISKLLLSYKKNIYSIFYRTSNEVCVLAEKDSLEIESLSDALNIHSKENDYDVELIEPEISDVLNLLLLSETKASDTSLYSFSYFNDAYYKILKSEKNIIKTLRIRFYEETKGRSKGNIYIDCKISTFSRYSLVKENREKYKRFYVCKNGYMTRCAKKDFEENELFVLKNIGKRSTVMAAGLTVRSFEGCKLQILGEIQNLFLDKKRLGHYINNLNYLKITDLKPCILNKKEIDDFAEKRKEFFEKNILNISYSGKDDLYILGELKELDKLNINYCYNSKNESGVNLVVLDYNKSEEKEKKLSEEIIKRDNSVYDADISSGIVCQHISRELLNNKDSLKTCLNYLMIKYSIKKNNVSYLFDWEKHYSHQKLISYYYYSRKPKDPNSKKKNKEWLYFYNKISINSNGEIIDFIIESPDEIDGCSKWFKFNEDDYEKHQEEDEIKYNVLDFGVLTDSFGNVLKFRNSNKFLVLPPETIKYAKEVIDNRNNYAFKSGDVFDILEKARKEIDDDIIDNVLLNSPLVQKGSIDDVFLDDLKFEKDGKIKGIFGYGSLNIKNYLEKEFDSLNIYTVLHIKDSEYIEDYCAGFRGIHYNDKYYTVGSILSPNNSANNILLKEIEVLEGKNIFEEVIPLISVVFVRNEQLTVQPFLQELLLEAIRNPNLRKVK